jgi:hypothetical protein
MEDLTRVGIRLTLAREWAQDGMLLLQFRIARTSPRAGVNVKYVATNFCMMIGSEGGC